MKGLMDRKPYGTAFIDGWRVIYDPYEFKKGKVKGKVQCYYRKGAGFKKVILDSMKNIKPLDDAYEGILLDLLSLIHRDGGQYVEEHGIHKALNDGRERIAKLLTIEEEEPW